MKVLKYYGSQSSDSLSENKNAGADTGIGIF
jgi:hypothetical protein